MRLLSTLKAVPRPDVSFLAVQGLSLVVFLGLEGREITVLGKPAAAIELTIAFFVMANLLRNIAFGPNLNRGRFAAAVTLLIVLGAALGLLAAVGAVTTFALQLFVTVWVLNYALILVIISYFDPESRARFPLIWASSPDYGRQACLLTALGYTLRATTLAALAFVASDLVWVTFLTLGWLVISFLTNWVIVMMILTTDPEGS